MDHPSRMAFIDDAPEEPVQFFSHLLKAYQATKPDMPFIPMSIATIDNEFGVLNRTLVFRGLQNDNITFVTEKNSRKYENLLKDPRISISFLFEQVDWHGSNTIWQVRLMGKAVELSKEQISDLWSQEAIYAKIRSRISVCGKPTDFADQKRRHDQLLEEFESGRDSLPQTETYTAFKVLPTWWDFYKSEPNCVADRVQYRKELLEDKKWKIMHVET